MSRTIVGALVALVAAASAAAAQDYPNRPIKFMHGFPPGGNVDIIGRLLGNEMSKGLGQSIVIEPKPGVAGSPGAGSILHTTLELIGNETKTKFLHIPYRGEAPAMTGLLQGDIDFIAATSGPISARIRSGEFRALAVTGKTRWREIGR